MPPRTDYIRLAETVEWDRYEQLVIELLRHYGDKPILYMPTMDAGLETGRRLEEEMGNAEVSYMRVPFLIDKRSGGILSPTPPDFRRLREQAMEELGDQLIYLIWDEVIGRGTTALMIYKYLLEEDILPGDIPIGALMDSSGITQGFCLFKHYDNGVHPRTRLEELQEEGAIDSIYPQTGLLGIATGGVREMIHGRRPDDVRRTQDAVSIERPPSIDPRKRAIRDFGDWLNHLESEEVA